MSGISSLSFSSFSQDDSRWAHPCCCTWHWFVLFYGCVIVHCVCIPRFLYPFSFSGHLVCFHVLAVVNSAEVNIRVHVSFCVVVLSGYPSRSGIAGSHNSIFGALRDSILFSIVAASIDFGSQLTHIPLQLTPTRVQSCHLPVIILVSPSTKVRLYLRTITPFSGIWEGVGLTCQNTNMIECDLCIKLGGDFLEMIGNILFAPLKTEVQRVTTVLLSPISACQTLNYKISRLKHCWKRSRKLQSNLLCRLSQYV